MQVSLPALGAIVQLIKNPDFTAAGRKKGDLTTVGAGHRLLDSARVFQEGLSAHFVGRSSQVPLARAIGFDLFPLFALKRLENNSSRLQRTPQTLF